MLETQERSASPTTGKLWESERSRTCRRDRQDSKNHIHAVILSERDTPRVRGSVHPAIAFDRSRRGNASEMAIHPAIQARAGWKLTRQGNVRKPSLARALSILVFFAASATRTMLPPPPAPGGRSPYAPVPRQERNWQLHRGMGIPGRAGLPMILHGPRRRRGATTGCFSVENCRRLTVCRDYADTPLGSY